MSDTKGALSTLAFCWRLERRDGAGLALTSHDETIVDGGIAYRSDPGVIPAAITRSVGLEPHSAEVAGALSAAALTEADLCLGRWDRARVTLLAADWEGGSQTVHLGGGELGEVAVSGSSFSAELHGAASRLSEPVCPSTSPECRAELGDKRCRIDLAGRTVRASVIAVEGAELQLDRQLDGRFLFGRLRYLAGANCGATSTLLGVDGNSVRVRDLPKAAIEAGSVVEIREGCDKRFDTCVSRFQNVVNFRGEPHLPGNDLLTRYPGA